MEDRRGFVVVATGESLRRRTWTLADRPVSGATLERSTAPGVRTLDKIDALVPGAVAALL